MRIELVTDTFPPDVNGVAMTLGRLVAGLRERGHLVHVLHTAEEGAKDGETSLPSVALPGYKEVRLGLPGRGRLFRRWRRKPPDVIYVATESPLGHSAIKAAAALGIPVAAGFHTNFDQYLAKYHLSGLRLAAQAYLKKVHNAADATFAPSVEVVERLRREGFRNVQLLGRGVDTELFRPARRGAGLRAGWGARNGTPVAMVVGRVAPEKNLPLAMEAFARMRATVPDLRCVVVGDGPIRARLERENPGVEFAGMRTGDDLARYYASADILLFPSETETFGNVLLEGMASGLLAVCYDYAAAARHVRHEVNGLKVKVGARDCFMEEALRAVDLPSWAGVRTEARRSVEPYGWNQVIDSFEERMQRLAGERITMRSRRRKKTGKLSFRTIFISDVHLGTKDSKVKEVVDFLKHTQCRRLVLNGDIIDAWALKRGGTWKKSHTRFIRTVLKLMEKREVEVIYLRGNHDDVLERFLPIEIGGMKVMKEYVHQTADGKRYLVVHGDGFDRVSTDYRWLAILGSIGYDFLLRFNRLYNHYRAWRGKEYFSMSKVIKARVKSAVSFVDRYQEQLQELARLRKCDGIICGHIHTPADEQVGEIHYLNSGDWVESLSCVVEHEEGGLEVLHYEEFLKRAQSRKEDAGSETQAGAGRTAVVPAIPEPSARVTAPT